MACIRVTNLLTTKRGKPDVGRNTEITAIPPPWPAAALCFVFPVTHPAKFYFLCASPTRFPVPFHGTIHGTRSLNCHPQRLNREKHEAELFTIHLETQHWSFSSAKTMFFCISDGRHLFHTYGFSRHNPAIGVGQGKYNPDFIELF